MDFNLKKLLEKRLQKLEERVTDNFSLRIRCAIEDLLTISRHLLENLGHGGSYVQLLDHMQAVDDIMADPDKFDESKKQNTEEAVSHDQ